MCMKTKHLHHLFETSVLVCLLIVFSNSYKTFIGSLFTNYKIVLICLVTCFLVNVIKYIRIYIIMYGQDVNNEEISLIYCKTAIVNSIVPYKLGELYRMWVFGYKLKDIQKGIIITLLDRFMDTIGILILLVGSIVFTNTKYIIYPIAKLLMVFLILTIGIYYLLPGLCSFWKKYLLKHKASKHKLFVLDIITKLQLLYKEIDTIVKGRGIILICCSVIAWLIETGSIYCINKILLESTVSIGIPDYLNSILSGNVNLDSARYTVFSITLLLTYLVVNVIVKHKKCEVKK